jgi:hypothetical protein
MCFGGFLTGIFNSFRGAGRLCRIKVLNKAGTVARLVLVDQSANNPYAGIGPTWKSP